MPGALDDITRTIEAMAHRARMARSGDPGAEPDCRCWWVLVLGESLDPDDEEQRELARETLRVEAVVHGLDLDEHVWVWDETDRAQLKAATFHDRLSAERYAQRLRGHGLEVRVVPAFDDD